MNEDRGVPVIIGGEEHRLTFTARAAYEISKRYGGLVKLGEMLTSDDSVETINEIVWLVMTLANQSIYIDNAKKKGNKKPLLTAEDIDLLSPFEVAAFTGPILEAYFKGMRQNIESEAEKEKNLSAGE